MPYGEDGGRSSDMGLKIPSKKYIGCIRDSFARILVPAVEEDFPGNVDLYPGK